MVRNMNPGPPESERRWACAPELKSLRSPAWSDRLVPDVLFSKTSLRQPCPWHMALPLMRYLPLEPTVPVTVSMGVSLGGEVYSKARECRFLVGYAPLVGGAEKASGKG